MKKIVLSIVALGGMFASAIPAAATEYPLGDLNCSGVVTSVDISIMMNAAVGIPRPAGCDTPIDLNCSGAVSSADISIIVHLAAGGTYTRPC
jgi:hypothetical protein